MRGQKNNLEYPQKTPRVGDRKKKICWAERVPTAARSHPSSTGSEQATAISPVKWELGGDFADALFLGTPLPGEIMLTKITSGFSLSCTRLYIPHTLPK